MNKSAITDHVAKENHVINWCQGEAVAGEAVLCNSLRCQNFGKRTSENQAGQGVDLDPERTQLHQQRWRGVQPMTVFWSRAQHHAGERNVATNLGTIFRLC